MTNELDKRWEDWACELSLPILAVTNNALFELLESFANLPPDQRSRLFPVAAVWASYIDSSIDPAKFRKMLDAWMDPNERAIRDTRLAQLDCDPDAWKRRSQAVTAVIPRLLSLADFLTRPRPSWLVDGLLPAGEMAVLFGAYARGKSFVALELAGCISQGRRFAGRPARLGKVLYLLAEGCAGMRDRFDIMVKEGLIDPENVFIDDSGRQIGNLGEREALLAELAAQNFKPDLIIVDTLARHAVGIEENSSKETGVWIAGVEALITELGCTVLPVHHVGNTNQTRMRGSSAMSGAISTSISCTKKDNLIVLKCDKQKDADEFAPISFRARKVRHGDIEALVLDHIDSGTPRADQLKPDELAILNALTIAYPSAIRRGDCKRSDNSLIPESSFERAINRLIDLKHAERIGQGEYLLRKSPSPNDPQESPMGIACASDKSPESPHHYSGGDMGMGAGVEEVKNVAPLMPSAAAGGYIERIEVPNFTELSAWPLPNQRYEEGLKH